ncbi:MAG: hypothetical protein MAG431_01590 [Chloroflexi bacterium]|nr:hypothetical protein [Chloroflexota bacterium]
MTKKNKNIIWPVFLGTLGGIWAAKKLLSKAEEMPHADHFQRVLAQKRATVEAGLLVSQAQARYKTLFEKRPHLANLALRSHLKDSILPGLALYQTLLEEGTSQEMVLAEVEVALEKTVEPSLKFIKLLERFPNQFSIFRWAVDLIMKLGFPPAGWEVEWLANDEHRVAFDIHGCFYLQILEYYGAPELVPVFCHTDDLIGEALPPSIRWERSNTLARGGEVCDFRWTYVKEETM